MISCYNNDAFFSEKYYKLSRLLIGLTAHHVYNYLPRLHNFFTIIELLIINMKSRVSLLIIKLSKMKVCVFYVLLFLSYSDN